MPNQLYFGDNLDVLRRHIPDSSVDLIYLDPPFNSKASYNILFREQSGDDSPAQITAFDDFWHWDMLAEATYHEVVGAGGPVGSLLEALRRFLGSNDMMAYLTMMAIRLKELHRVLKQTGSIYLHCDPTASHYLKLLMDAVFGPLMFRNEIVWKRSHGHNTAKGYGADHDILLFYLRTVDATWNPVYQAYSDDYLDKHYRHVDADGRRYKHENPTGPGASSGVTGQPWRGIDPTPKGRHWARPPDELELLNAQGRIYWPGKPGAWPYIKLYLDEMPGIPAQDTWTDINPINMQAKERLGYPTQKPEALLERIIRASSNEGDLVLDPFCGCGTTIAVAERLHRRWIGIDVTHLAIALMRKRLHDTFGDQLSPYEVHGEPTDLPSAQALARHDPYQFQFWALGLADARPVGNTPRKGADGGVDGEIIFFDDDSGQARRVVLSVKSGHVNVAMVRELIGILDRQRADIGAFITLEPPTAPMLVAATETGFYQPPGLLEAVPRLQILTVEQLLSGQRLQYPKFATGTFTRAPRQHKRPRRG